MKRLSLLVIATVSLLAACGGSAPTATPAPEPTATGSKPEILPILVNSELVKGSNRFLFSLTDQPGRLIAAPDVAVHLKFLEVGGSEDAPAFEADATFLWAIEGAQGLYVADATYPSAGRWATRFVATFPDKSQKTVRLEYDVRETGSTPPLGASAPSVDTPIASDVNNELARLTTDKVPAARFYAISIADALAAKKPFVVVFATPLFCETQLCGPTLETVKGVAKDYPDITFINVEPYVMAFKDGSLQPVLSESGELQAAEWTTAWGLLSEPYTFVIDADGKVTAKFEGVLGAQELRDALDAL